MTIAVGTLTPSCHPEPLSRRQAHPRTLRNVWPYERVSWGLQGTKSRASIKNRNSLKSTRQMSPHEAGSCVVGQFQSRQLLVTRALWTSLTPILCAVYPRDGGTIELINRRDSAQRFLCTEMEGRRRLPQARGRGGTRPMTAGATAHAYDRAWLRNAHLILRFLDPRRRRQHVFCVSQQAFRNGQARPRPAADVSQPQTPG